MDTQLSYEFTREELQNIREKAKRIIPMVVTDWVRAYEDLADATDRLDAMIARSCVREEFVGCISTPDVSPREILEDMRSQS